MSSTVELPLSGEDLASTLGRRLFVSWQDPDTRAIVPVARLRRVVADGSADYEFRYLRRALDLPRFRPFVSFPRLRGVYRAPRLFPLFENRLMPRNREDYGDYVAALALDREADPFEVLGRSGGRRVTDNIEVFPEPVLDPVTRTATCRFLVRGVRHVSGAQDAIEHLTPGELLHVLNDPHNDYDTLALLLRTGEYRLVGYVPAFLTSVIHRSAEARSWEDVGIVVEHVGDRDGPVHLRLLCRLEMAWPFDEPPFAGPEFELMEPE